MQKFNRECRLVLRSMALLLHCYIAVLSPFASPPGFSPGVSTMLDGSMAQLFDCYIAILQDGCFSPGVQPGGIHNARRFDCSIVILLHGCIVTFCLSPSGFSPGVSTMLDGSTVQLLYCYMDVSSPFAFLPRGSARG